MRLHCICSALFCSALQEEEQEQRAQSAGRLRLKKKRQKGANRNGHMHYEWTARRRVCTAHTMKSRLGTAAVVPPARSKVRCCVVLVVVLVLWCRVVLSACGVGCGVGCCVGHMMQLR